MKDITACINDQIDIDDIILIGDINKDINSKNIESFLFQSGLIEIYSFCDEKENQKRDSTC